MADNLSTKAVSESLIERLRRQGAQLSSPTAGMFPAGELMTEAAATLERLERENTGRRAALKAERRKRQAAEAQVEALRKALEKIAAGHVFPYFIAREALALSAPAEESVKPEVELTIEEALQESAYLSGMKAGWNFGIAEDKDGYLAAVKGREGYLKPITEARRAARAQAEESAVYPAGWVLVPNDPTDAMCDAFMAKHAMPHDEHQGEPWIWEGDFGNFAASWQAALSCASQGATPAEARSEQAGWRPIETAPKDGTAIVCAARYDFAAKWVFWTDYWRTYASGLEGFGQPRSTHWMPLPAPPTEAEQ